MTARSPVISARKLRRTFPPDVVALDDITLDVRSGEWLAIVGSSGSGKSTLMNLLGLLDRPDSGAYELCGQAAAQLSEDERTTLRATFVGFVFQAYHLVPYLTVLENVELGLRYAGVGRAKRGARAQEALALVDLTRRSTAFPATLSGGEQQRVAIARAIASEPSLLLCDEPTGNLDSLHTESVLRVVEEIHSRGQTIVMITHDSAVAARAERLIEISDGAIVSTSGHGQ